MAVVLLYCLLSERHEVGADDRHPNRFAILLNAGLLQRLRLVLHWITPYRPAAGRIRPSPAAASRTLPTPRPSASRSAADPPGPACAVCASPRAASVTPNRSASSTAPISRSQPSDKPPRTSAIISRVPPLLPCRVSSFLHM